MAKAPELTMYMFGPVESTFDCLPDDVIETIEGGRCATIRGKHKVPFLYVQEQGAMMCAAICGAKSRRHAEQVASELWLSAVLD